MPYSPAVNDHWNSFWSYLPASGNYWSDWTTPDSNSDGSVDTPYVISTNGVTSGKDWYSWTNRDGWYMPNYYWTWYDCNALQNWVLLANHAGAGGNLNFNYLRIGNSQETLPDRYGLGVGPCRPAVYLPPHLPRHNGRTGSGNCVGYQRPIPRFSCECNCLPAGALERLL